MVWVSEQRSKPANTKSAGYKFCQISAGLKGFSFSQGCCGEWESVSEQTTKSEKNAVERQKDRVRVRDGVRDRHADARKTARETEKLRENVIWSGCFGLHAPFALPYREGE